MDIKVLKDAGVDVDGLMERMMNNEGLADRLLNKFLEDKNYGLLNAAVAQHDGAAAVAAAHGLKGTCGNLSLSVLYGLFTRQVQLFREDDWDGAVALMPEIAAAYDKVAAGIRANAG